MKIKKWKEVKPKEKGIILFTVLSILLIVGVFFYQSFAIFKIDENQDLIEGNVENMGDLEFAFYKDSILVDKAPEKDKGYSLDTSSSYCKNMKTGERITMVSWDNEKWGPTLSNVDTTKTKCFLNFKQIYEEKELDGAIPDLMNGRLLPVVISDTYGPNGIDGASGGKVTKADITDEKEPWYSYSNKKWANAVILKDGVEDTYQPGEEIHQTDIESYFVWIPRYQYQLKKSENELNQYTTFTPMNEQVDVNAFYGLIGGNQAIIQPFKIKFGSKESEDIEGYKIHPAFTAFDTNGLWVGKFETGYKGATSTEAAAKVENTNKIDRTKVIIKPNVYSWRNIQVGNAFYTSYEYKRDLESHMMKNTEWGAVAYLTQSKYGRCTNNSCDEVSMNNESSYITGWSTTTPPTCGNIGANESCNYHGGPVDLNTLFVGDLYSYYKIESEGGSTTGNYYGIYDMAGGTWEYVMGVMQSKVDNKNPASGQNSGYNSGFNGFYSSMDGKLENGLEWPSRKYYDLYDYSLTAHNYQRGILGDATKEMGPFYSVKYQKQDGSYGSVNYVSSYGANIATFVNSNAPWFHRGGSCADGTNAGIFAFKYDYGHATAAGFRIVLVP